ncbi:CRISPR-associated endonuclease Cas1, partial [Nesterenkonia alkaliphila]
MAAWQVLDLLNYEGKVRTERGAFSIDGRRIPLESLSTALIGPKCSISSGVPHHAAKYDVVVLFCDWKGEPLSALLPWSDNTRTGARMQAQATLSEPRRKNAWMRVIKAKITSQGRTLEMAGKRREGQVPCSGVTGSPSCWVIMRLRVREGRGGGLRVRWRLGSGRGP